MPYDENDPRQRTPGATFDQAAGGATPSAAFDRAANMPLERQAIGGQFREGSIGTAPVGSIDYTTTAGGPTGPSGMVNQIPNDSTRPGPIAAQAPQGSSLLGPPPGGGYFTDRMAEAGAMYDRGNVAGAAGTAISGLVTSMPVAVGESLYGAGKAVNAAVGPVADAGMRFVRGAAGIEAPGPIASAAAAGPQNAVPGASVMVPRGPGPQYGNEGRGGPQAPAADPYGPGQSVAVPQGGGTITMGGTTVNVPTAPSADAQQARAVIGNPLINAELQRYQAQDAQRVQQSNEAMRQNGAWADAWTAQRDAEGRARVANFTARNGADMVLRGGNSRNNPQATAILAEQAAANAGLSEANKNLAGVYGQKGPITDYVGQQQKQQALDQQGQKNANDAISKQADTAAKQADTEGKKLDAAAKKQLLELQQQLLGAKTPEERKSIEEKILAIHGRAAPQDKVAVIDVDTGQKDMMGQPIFKKAAINTVTGQFLGNPQQQGADPVATVKGLGVEQAHAQAKQAIAAGAKLADVNARLKAAGLPTL